MKCNTHLIPRRVGGNAGTRLEACDSPACDDIKRGLECYSPYLVPRMGRMGALGHPLLPAGGRGGGKQSRDAQLATLPLLGPRD